MSLAVLSEEDIRGLLESLTQDEAEVLAHSLKCALHEYSTGTQSIEAGLLHQPERTALHSTVSNTTTLCVPSVSPAGHGVKVMTLSTPDADPDVPLIKPTGALTLFSPDGMPMGCLQAQTLTAFRSALASSCLLTKRAQVRTLTVFGAGLQAYWHIRLTLLLRGSTIKDVNIINRRFSDNARTILKKFYAIPNEIKQREGWENCQFSVLTPGYADYERLQREHLLDSDVIYCCTPSTEPLFDPGILTTHEGRRKGRLIVAIGSYGREMRELPRELLEQATKVHKRHMHWHKHATEGGVIVVDTLDGALKEAGEIVDAGLEPQQLVELGELVMIHRARILERSDEDSSPASSNDASPEMEHLHLTPASPSLSMVLGPESGGTEDSNRSPSGRSGSFFRRRRSSQMSTDKPKQDDTDHLSNWLESGNVIYKSVGLGLMDLVVGIEVIRLAQAKGVGSHVERFS